LDRTLSKKKVRDALIQQFATGAKHRVAVVGQLAVAGKLKLAAVVVPTLERIHRRQLLAHMEGEGLKEGLRARMAGLKEGLMADRES